MKLSIFLVALEWNEMSAYPFWIHGVAVQSELEDERFFYSLRLLLGHPAQVLSHGSTENRVDVPSENDAAILPSDLLEHFRGLRPCA